MNILEVVYFMKTVCNLEKDDDDLGICAM